MRFLFAGLIVLLIGVVWEVSSISADAERRLLPAPTIMAALSGDGTITLIWEKPEHEPSHYDIYVFPADNSLPSLAPNRGASVTLTTYEPVTSYTITGLKNGLKYRIKFQYDAYGDGWSGYSTIAWAEATPKADRPFPPLHPGKPRFTKRIALDGGIEIAWDTPFSPVGAPIEKYQLYYLNHQGEDSNAWTVLELPGSTDKYTIEGLENGDDHHIYLRAFNRFGEGLWAGIKGTPDENGPKSVPDSPIIGEVVTTEDSATIHWDPPEFEVGSPIDGYFVGVVVDRTDDDVANYDWEWKWLPSTARSNSFMDLPYDEYEGRYDIIVIPRNADGFGEGRYGHAQLLAPSHDAGSDPCQLLLKESYVAYWKCTYNF